MPRTIGENTTIKAILPKMMAMIGTTSGGTSGLTWYTFGGWTVVPACAGAFAASTAPGVAGRAGMGGMGGGGAG